MGRPPPELLKDLVNAGICATETEAAEAECAVLGSSRMGFLLRVRIGDRSLVWKQGRVFAVGSPLGRFARSVVRSELHFYAQLVPDLEPLHLRLWPRTHRVVAPNDGGGHRILMDDLAQFGFFPVGVSGARRPVAVGVVAALRELHLATRGRGEELLCRNTTFKFESPVKHARYMAGLMHAGLNLMVQRLRTKLPRYAEALHTASQLGLEFAASLWVWVHSGPATCLVHGDCHAENVMTNGGGAVFIDWAPDVQRGPCDLASFLVTGLETYASDWEAALSTYVGAALDATVRRQYLCCVVFTLFRFASATLLLDGDEIAATELTKFDDACAAAVAAHGGDALFETARNVVTESKL